MLIIPARQAGQHNISICSTRVNRQILPTPIHHFILERKRLKTLVNNGVNGNPRADLEQDQPEAVDLVLAVVLRPVPRVCDSQFGVQIDVEGVEVLVERLSAWRLGPGDEEADDVGGI